MQRAFSLVELSIVLVILGLLTGGILAGQSLVRASQLRGFTTEYSRYITAVHAFRDKYFELPGDFSKATSYWPSAGGNGANAACAAATSRTTTCSGNGDSIISIMNSGSVPESGTFWQHLAFAGLIEGAYNGTAAAVPGSSTPISKIPNAFYLVYSGGGYYAGDTFNFPGDYGRNQIGFTGVNPSSYPFKPEEAWNIDTKIDDGKPGGGAVYGNKGNGTTVICTTGDNVAPPGDANATYVLSNNAKTCGLSFLRVF